MRTLHTFTADAPLGAYQGVTDQVDAGPVLVPRGSCEAAWRERGSGLAR